MKYFLSVTTLCLVFTAALAQGGSGFALSRTFKIGSPGGWDYISVGPDHKLYVSHGTQVNILDERTGDSIDVIPNTTGVHGIAFDEALGKGYTSNGRLNTVSVFDLTSFKVKAQIPTGQNPDAIFYEPFSKTIVTCNGRSHDLSVIDPSKDQVIATIALDGKPETAVSDEAGRLYVNIEDKNEISVVDMRKNTVITSWPLGADGPTGLIYDAKDKRLFAGCDKEMVALDATTGKVLSKLPIGAGCDGVGFDSSLGLVFASCGEGKLTVVQASSLTVIDNVPTKRSARTCAVDSKTHAVFLPAADTEPGAPGERPKQIPGTFGVLVVTRK